MPQIRCTVEKYMPAMGEYWTNVYILNATSLEDAYAHGLTIAQAERPLYTAATFITKYRVDDMVEDTDVVMTNALNLPGTRGAQATQFAPLFVTVRCDFTIYQSGHPLRKYLRGVLYEADFSALALTQEVIDLVQVYATAVANLPVVDPDGNEILAGVVFPMPQMRQLRRGSKKKDPQSSPGLT